MLKLRDEHFNLMKDEYDLISDIILNNKPLDSSIFIQEMNKKGLDLTQTLKALRENPLIDKARLEYHITEVRDKFYKNSLKYTLDLQLSKIEKAKTSELITETQNVMELINNEYLEGITESTSDHIKAYKKHKLKLWAGEIEYLKTGLKDLDKVLLGFKAGNLIIIGARPSVGKSALMLKMINNQRNKKIALFSIEMTRNELFDRFISQEIKTSMTKLNEPLNDKLRQKFNASLLEIEKRDLFINDVDNSLDSIISEIKSRYISTGLDAVYIDYLGKINTKKKFNSRNEQMGYITGTLKNLSKRLSIPIILLSQLNRDIKDRPRLDNLRDSGEIEQDADVVIIIDRPEKDGKTEFADGSSCEGIARLLIDKNRNGATGYVEVAFNKEYALYENLDKYINDKDIGF